MTWIYLLKWFGDVDKDKNVGTTAKERIRWKVRMLNATWKSHTFCRRATQHAIQSHPLASPKSIWLNLPGLHVWTMGQKHPISVSSGWSNFQLRGFVCKHGTHEFHGSSWKKNKQNNLRNMLAYLAYATFWTLHFCQAWASKHSLVVQDSRWQGADLNQDSRDITRGACWAEAGVKNHQVCGSMITGPFKISSSLCYPIFEPDDLLWKLDTPNVDVSSCSPIKVVRTWGIPKSNIDGYIPKSFNKSHHHPCFNKFPGCKKTPSLSLWAIPSSKLTYGNSHDFTSKKWSIISINSLQDIKQLTPNNMERDLSIYHYSILYVSMILQTSIYIYNYRLQI